MSKQTYIVRVNCVGFKDYHITAKTQEDAIHEAQRMFQCDGTECEFGEILDESSSMNDGHSEVVYPGEDN